MTLDSWDHSESLLIVTRSLALIQGLSGGGQATGSGGAKRPQLRTRELEKWLELLPDFTL